MIILQISEISFFEMSISFFFNQVINTTRSIDGGVFSLIILFSKEIIQILFIFSVSS